jgi:hypothetical protein
VIPGSLLVVAHPQRLNITSSARIPERQSLASIPRNNFATNTPKSFDNALPIPSFDIEGPEGLGISQVWQIKLQFRYEHTFAEKSKF